MAPGAHYYLPLAVGNTWWFENGDRVEDLASTSTYDELQITVPTDVVTFKVFRSNGYLNFEGLDSTLHAPKNQASDFGLITQIGGLPGPFELFKDDGVSDFNGVAPGTSVLSLNTSATLGNGVQATGIDTIYFSSTLTALTGTTTANEADTACSFTWQWSLARDIGFTNFFYSNKNACVGENNPNLIDQKPSPLMKETIATINH